MQARRLCQYFTDIVAICMRQKNERKLDYRVLLLELMVYSRRAPPQTAVSDFQDK